MKIPHTPVLRYSILTVFLVVILAQFLYLIKVDGMYRKREKAFLSRLNRIDATIEESTDGYAIYVNDKFYDYKTY